MNEDIELAETNALRLRELMAKLAPDKEDDDAEKTVGDLIEKEENRKLWCVQTCLHAYNLETNENNFIRIADRIYDYVYGKRV